jgi:hypothetical protein
MADSFTHASGNPVKLVDIGSNQYAVGVSIESGSVTISGGVAVDSINTVSVVSNIANISNGTVTIIEKTVSSEPTISLTTLSTASTVIATANSNRKILSIQNVGVQPALIRLGGTVSTALYNMVLSADSGTRSGTGGSVELANYTGQVGAITETGTTIITTFEM